MYADYFIKKKNVDLSQLVHFKYIKKKYQKYFKYINVVGIYINIIINKLSNYY